MSGFVDFEEVKTSVPIERAVELLGLELKERNDQLRGQCPICEAGERILCITPAKSKWYCFGCKTGGDVIALAAHIRGEHPKDAAHFLIGTQPAKKPNGEKSNKVEHLERGFKQLDYLQPDHDAVEALGIGPEDAERIGCGYAPRGVLKGTVAWPVRTQDGTLIGYIGLTEIAKLPPKWTF